MQSGSYEIMIDSATRYFSGHGQVSDASYFDQPRFERTVLNAAALQAELETIDGLSVMPRVQVFAVVSMGEKSLGGMVMGVDFAAETRFLDIYDNVIVLSDVNKLDSAKETKQREVQLKENSGDRLTYYNYMLLHPDIQK